MKIKAFEIAQVESTTGSKFDDSFLFGTNMFFWSTLSPKLVEDLVFRTTSHSCLEPWIASQALRTFSRIDFEPKLNARSR